MDYKRIFIEKKKEVAVESKKLLKEFREFVGVESIKDVRVINVYDLINVPKEEIKSIIHNILYEPAVDLLHTNIPMELEEKAFRVEYLKGQYNQREDSTMKLINDYLSEDEVHVNHSKIIVCNNVSIKDMNRIKSYYINRIEAKEVALDSFSYVIEDDTAEDIEVLEKFIDMDELSIKSLKSRYGIVMDMDDLLFIQTYFKNEEKRNPTITEIKLIDTYWSDHCRHTTFMTEVVDIKFDEGKYKDVLEGALKKYVQSREYVYGETSRPIALMDLATINMKEIKKKGLLDDIEESDEINAASIEIDVDVDGKDEKWLLMFKNETHNHPTEMEPFGGAGTCLGGAIRDPLSGRSFVYQAMRISGSADPRQKFEDTLPGKLPQRKITRTAMEGYSSYGNQIGAATGYIKEIYDEGYMAKRLECGALVAAAPKDAVYRGNAEPGDLIILVGGRTGRDGLGGAVGSSKGHTEDSLQSSGAEVQKGNPPLERKILRFFRNKEVSTMIKVCNDFGAGGVGVAIGELADGVLINLDKVPLKYKGLDGTEIALSESQERMAVVIEKKNFHKFMMEAEKEDLEATLVAEVTEEKILKMLWKDKTIVNIKRSFLDTNGVRKKSNVHVTNPEGNYMEKIPSYLENKSIKESFIENMTRLNSSSQKGLVERFDHTVGGGTVLMPFGGKYKLSPSEGMVAKIPVLKGNTSTCSIMTYGYEPEISKWSPFHGGYYAVIESIAKVVALGGDYKKIRLTFQEYFERLGEDERKWGKPFAALLGAYLVQKELDIPSIGGKDSMSGSFEDIDVPPTLISFAVGHDKTSNIISNEFKDINNKVVLVPLEMDNYGLIDFKELKTNYSHIKKLVNEGKILSMSTVKHGGVAKTISEMSFGNKIGFEFNPISIEELFLPLFGSIVIEISCDENEKEIFKDVKYKVLGKTIKNREIYINNETINLDELIDQWEAPLEEVFPIKEEVEFIIEEVSYSKGNKIFNSFKTSKPKVLITVFTGTHGEYTMAQAFERAGGEVETFVFRSLTKKHVKESFIELAKKIKESQIIGLANGATFGNEPETGGKLINLILRNPLVAEEINNHLNIRDGLILGIGNGLQGLFKLGLIENNEISNVEEGSSHIIYNSKGEFISTMGDIKLVSNLSPWTNEMKLGSIYTSPVATNEGRIIIGSNGKELIDNGQIVTQFVKENITGSNIGIESITNPTGRVYGTVSSIDRIVKDQYKNMDIKGISKIFESGIKYFG